MAVFVRALLIWLLVLAIPAQGAAAAIMVPCGPNHHTGGAAQSAVSATASSHAHHGGALHAQEFDLRGAAAAVIADDATATAKPGPGAKQTCNACASCCSLNAMLTWVPVVLATDSAPAVFDAVVPTVNAFAADGSDRPPRNSFV